MAKERVIQFGEGGFLRGFVDWMLQKLSDKGLFEGSVVVVQPIEKGMCDLLESQNCKYTHIARGREGIDKTKIEIISRCVNPYEDFEEYLALADNPDMRFIVSNTTEAGIVFSAEDKIDDIPPNTFPAKLTLLLKRRFENGLKGFIILPCELIDKNGESLKKAIISYIDLWQLPDSFKEWVEKENIFTNTLVDRINTGYPKGEDLEELKTDKMLNTSEFFHLWVIETDYNIEKELPFSKAGLNVIVTKDKLSLYRTRKVRILNGAHTSLVAYGLLEGFDTVKSCMDNEKMYEYIHKCVYEEIIPTLNLDEDELISYADSVMERFKNPYIKHYLSSIALNSVSKFKVRVLPSILEYKKKFGKYPEALIFSLEKLIEFYKSGNPNDTDEAIEYMKDITIEKFIRDNENQ